LALVPALSAERTEGRVPLAGNGVGADYSGISDTDKQTWNHVDGVVGDSSDTREKGYLDRKYKRTDVSKCN
jgi:hypothetical protein